MTVDNFDLVRKYLVFDNDNDSDLFYYVQIIQRRKDEGVSIEKNCKMIRSYYITSLRYWDEHIEQIKELCRTFKARAYIHLNARSWKKCTLMAFGELASYLRNNRCSSLRKLNDEMAGKYIADGAEKTWIVDIDSKDNNVVDEISSVVNECMPQGVKTIDLIPTKNGYHLITKPFNIMEFRKHYKEGEVDVQKNNPTLLYYENGENVDDVVETYNPHIKFTDKEKKAARDFAYDLDGYLEGKGPNIADVIIGFYGGLDWQKKQGISDAEPDSKIVHEEIKWHDAKAEKPEIGRDIIIVENLPYDCSSRAFKGKYDGKNFIFGCENFIVKDVLEWGYVKEK